MQPFTPLRQQHHIHNTNSRPRRSTGEGSSRRSARLVAATKGLADGSISAASTASPRRGSITSAKEALAPPLDLSMTRARKRRREQQDEEGEDAAEIGEVSKPTSAAAATAISLDGPALRRQSAVVDASLLSPNGPNDSNRRRKSTTAASRDLADLFANGRALYNATTTSLAAPVEIPSKKQRLSNTPVTASASIKPAAVVTAEEPSSRTRLRTRSTAAPPPPPPAGHALATPQHTAKRSLTAANNANTGSARSNNNRSSRTKRARVAQDGQATAANQKRVPALERPSEIVTAQRRTRAQKDEDRRLQQEHEAAEWAKKYRRAFKSFVFYFDGFDATRRKEAEKYVRDLGARVENFFSKQVSHVVTTRPIPEKLLAPSSLNAPATSATLTATQVNRANIFQPPALAANGKENVQPLSHLLQPRNSSESPVKQGGKDAFAGHSKRAKTRLGGPNANAMILPAMKTPTKVKPYVDLDRTDSNDILAKAQSFGMKLWNVEKLVRVLERLIPNDSPSQSILHQQTAVNVAATAAAGYAYSLQMNNTLAKSSLPSLLRAEAMAGSTYERDLSTLRPDHHYFNPRNGYILVEDSSGDFAPAHAKEFEQRIVVRPTETKDRDTEWPTLWGGQEGRQAFCKASASHKPPLPSLALIQANQKGPIVTLQRSMSLDALSAKSARREGQPDSQMADPGSYLAASGNSQIITSNIQSGTSTRSGQNVGDNVVKVGGNSLANGLIINKHLARLGSKNAHVVTLGRNSLKTTSNATYAAEISQRASGQMKRTVSLDTGLKDLKNLKPPKPAPKKPGYCENCRIRFDDFKSHTLTRKHRRFALDDSNWDYVDRLFAKIKRPINPELQELYDDAECEVPSDVEMTDKEDDVDMSDDGEDEDAYPQHNAVDDSGYGSQHLQGIYEEYLLDHRRTQHALVCTCGGLSDECEAESDPVTGSEGEEDDEDEEEDVAADWTLRGAVNGTGTILPEIGTDNEVETSEEEEANESLERQEDVEW